MRTLETHLEEALNSEAEPYLQLQYCTSGAFTWINAPYPMFSYKLGGLEFNLNTAGTAIYAAYAIRLLRGAYNHKTPHYETSSLYYVNKKIITQKEQVEIQATIFPRGNNYKYSVNGNQTYQTIIDAICAQFGYTAAYESPAAAFWDNIFYPAGRTLTLQSPHSFFTLLRQKLFIYAQDNNDNDLYFRQWIDDGLVGTGGHPDLETIVTFDWSKKYSFQSRSLLWRDENSTTHWYPDPTAFPNRPIYNMGYIESTAATPTCSQSWHENEDKRTFHLKYQDGDIIECSSGDYQIKVYEVFNRKESPSLYTQFVALPKFTTTEGGPLPGTIEAAAPYTPLNVSPFVLNLNSTDNNLQALAEAVDELTGGPAMYAGSAKDPLVDADEFAVIDSETSTHLIRKFTWTNLKARVFAALGLATDAATAKATPVDGDLIPLVDSETAGRLVKKFTWADLKAMLITTGTWSPGIAFGGNSTGLTYSGQTGYYTKIGNLVNISGFIVMTNKGSSTGSATIKDLPFTVVNNPSGYAVASLSFNKITFANQYYGSVAINTKVIELYEVTEAGVQTALTNADFANDSVIFLSCTYRAA